MAKMKLNKGVRSDHARYRFEVSSISATCSASEPCFAQWNEANAARVGGQLLGSGRHPGDFGCRRTSCTLLDILSAGGLRAGPIELGRSYGLDGEVVPEDPIGFLAGSTCSPSRADSLRIMQPSRKPKSERRSFSHILWHSSAEHQRGSLLL